MKKEEITVAIVEDDKGIQETLAKLLNDSPGFRSLGAFETGEEAVEALPTLHADVTLVDINLPSMLGIELIALLKEKYPNMQFLVLTVYEESEKIFRALEAGASGYLLKRTSSAELLAAIADIKAGGSPMSSSIARKVVQSFHKQGPATGTGPRELSPRETEILQCLADGYLYKEIADRMGISIETVRTHIRRIYEKLHVRSRTEAVVKWLRHPPTSDPN